MQTNFTEIPRTFRKRREGFNFSGRKNSNRMDSGIKIFSVPEFYRKVNLDPFQPEMSALLNLGPLKC